MRKCKLSVHVEYSDTLSEEEIRRSVASSISKNYLVKRSVTTVEKHHDKDVFTTDGVAVYCRDCDDTMSLYQMAAYRGMCGEIQRTEFGMEDWRFEAICTGCVEVRQAQDDFDPEDFMSEFCE